MYSKDCCPLNGPWSWQLGEEELRRRLPSTTKPVQPTAFEQQAAADLDDNWKCLCEEPAHSTEANRVGGGLAKPARRKRERADAECRKDDRRSSHEHRANEHSLAESLLARQGTSKSREAFVRDKDELDAEYLILS